MSPPHTEVYADMHDPVVRRGGKRKDQEATPFDLEMNGTVDQWTSWRA